MATGARFLYIGLNKCVGDPRLFYRQMAAVREACPQAKLYFLAGRYKGVLGGAGAGDVAGVRVLTPPPASQEADLSRHGRLRRGLQRRGRRLRRAARFRAWTYRTALRLQPDVVQASDARELPFAVALKALTGCTVIYDGHEDYFNQVYEHRDKSWRALRDACWLASKEFALARFCDHMFVTSAAHRQKYRRHPYGQKTIHLLRNFAPARFVPASRRCEAASHLRLVYVGTVNRYRGVVQTARFCKSFNERHAPARSLSFHYMGLPSPLIDELLSEDLVEDHGAYAYPKMMAKLPEFDVGVCLLGDIRKHHTSVPVKNFDYMAAGLPVLTGNFGPMQRYVREAQAGFCIDPQSYEAFEEAVLTLFDPAVRERMGRNGRRYTEGPGSFKTEAQAYVETVAYALMC